MNKAAPKNIIKSICSVLVAVARRVLPLLYYTIIFATILGVAGAFFSVSYLKSPGPLTEDKIVIISSGSSILSIAKQLGENRIIEFPQLFAVIVKLSKAGSLKAGEYAFEPYINPMEVFKKIESGKVVVRKFTIAEGLSTFQILEMIKKDPLQKGAMPDGILEGELLPETYEYHYDDKREDMVKRMQEAMRSTIDELWKKRQENLPIKTTQEALILASIIEKETSVAEERKRVSAVFVNRLKKNMRLQTDPSVIYAITKGEYVLARPLSNKDLEIDSGYNTYRNIGLPPGPIANPGRASIEAALNPQNTDDLYFVASGIGGHLFSSNLKQHNENVAKLRRIEKEMKKTKTD